MLADFAVVPMGVTGGVKGLVAEALKELSTNLVFPTSWEPCTPPSKEIPNASWTLSSAVIAACWSWRHACSPASPSTIAEAQPAVLKARSEMWNRYSASRSRMFENNVY